MSLKQRHKYAILILSLALLQIGFSNSLGQSEQSLEQQVSVTGSEVSTARDFFKEILLTKNIPGG